MVSNRIEWIYKHPDLIKKCVNLFKRIVGVFLRLLSYLQLATLVTIVDGVDASFFMIHLHLEDCRVRACKDGCR